LSRNISTIEKAIILILIAAAVLGAGGYFLALPEFRKIEVVDAKIAQKEADIRRAQELKEIVMTIGDDFEVKRERAEAVHERFYDEMTTTEAITEVQRILSEFNGGVEPVSGITVTDVGETRLSLQIFTGGHNIRYSLRELALLFGGPPVEEVEEVNPINLIITHLFGEEPDLEDSDVQTRISAINESRAILIKEIITALSATGSDAIVGEDRDVFISTVRYLLAIETSGVGLTTARFALELSYADYLNFLDYINNLPHATIINTATLWESDVAAGNELRGYAFTLSLCAIKPIYIPEKRPNPFADILPPAQETEEEEDTEDE
jgi:hypothetical protein